MRGRLILILLQINLQQDQRSESHKVVKSEGHKVKIEYLMQSNSD